MSALDVLATVMLVINGGLFAYTVVTDAKNRRWQQAEEARQREAAMRRLTQANAQAAHHSMPITQGAGL